MPGYGDYEPYEEIHRGAFAAIWKARRRGGRPDEVFAVKVCQPSPWAEEAVEKAGLFADLAEQAGDLRTLGERGARQWAPMLASGESDDEAWWATRFYSRSLERVIEGRAQLEGADIQWIAISVVRGLIELQRHLARPHGALKPANIFIDGDGRLLGLPVVLSDPKPRSQIDEPVDRAADFHALGRMIVHLVRRQYTNLQAAIGWPLEPGAEWRRLGRRAESWRALCNVLLNPNPASREHDWVAIEQRLRLLEGSGRRPWVAAVSVGAPLVLVLGAGLVYLRAADYPSMPETLKPLARLLGNVPPDVAEMPPEWATLCTAFYEWGGAFMQLAGDSSKSAAWRRDPYLQEKVLGGLLSAQERFGSLDPRRLAGVSGDLRVLADQDLDAVKKGTVVYKIVETSQAVKAAREAFLNWPDRVRLASLASDFAARGWTKVGAELQAVVDSGASGALTADGLNDVLRLNEAVTRYGSISEELKRRTDVLAGSGDPVMAGLFAHLTRTAADAPDLDSVNRALATAVEDSARWLDLVQDAEGKPRFDRDRFQQESDVLRGFSGEVTASVLQRWEREVEGYQFVGADRDPRRQYQFQDLTDGIEDTIADIDKEEKISPDSTGAAARLGAALAEARSQVGALQARPILRKDIDPLEAEARQLANLLDGLARQAREELARIAPRPGQWLELVRGVSYGADGSAIRRQWDGRRSELLAGTRAEDLEEDKEAFIDMRQRYNRLEAFFRELASGRGERLPVFDPAGIDKDFAGPLAAWAAARADDVARDWFRIMRWTGGAPNEDAATFFARADVGRVTQDYATALQEAAQCGRAFTAGAARLAEGGGLDDPAVGALNEWRARPLFKDVAAEPGFRALTETIDTLDSLQRERDTARLLAAAGSPALSVAWAAWRGLGSVPAWPAIADLERESTLQDDLRRRSARAVADTARLSSLENEIQREAVRRWRVAFRTARDDAAVAAVVAAQKRFGVDEAALEPGERFNLELHRLKQVDFRTMPGERLIAARDNAVRRLRDLLAGQPPSDVAAWLSEIDGLVLAEPEGGQADPTRLGPATKGWAGTLLPDGALEFRRPPPAKDYVLRFRSVESDDVAPFFLCTVELPVGLAVDLASKAPARARLQEWLANALDEGFDVRMGPRVWKLDPRRGMVLADDWTGDKLPTVAALPSLYADEIPDPGRPDANMPVQYLPAPAAAFLAGEVLGCRLPTLEEWPAIRRLAQAELAGANVRDRTWLAERDYLVAHQVLAHESPLDGEIFWPSSEGAQKRGRMTQPVAADRSDGALWFKPVADGAGGDFEHLAGNVAEYLFDEAADQYYVVGGSALSPPEVDPMTPYPLRTQAGSIGFSDVGVRLAFDAPGSLVERNRLQRLIRSRAYLQL